MSKLVRILQQYGLQPYQGEKLSSKTIKISTGDQYVVLKRSKNKHVEEKFQNVYKIAREHQLTNIVPLYLTRQNRMVVNGKSHVYYLMPWLKENVDPIPTYQMVLREIAIVHEKTKFEKKIDLSLVDEWYKKQKEKVRKSFNRFERWIASFEAKHFMSPAELLICHLYPTFRSVCQNLEYWYDEWATYIVDDKSVNLALCHGQLTPSHLLHTTKGAVLINWEKSFYGEPVQDLAIFFSTTCQSSNVNRDDLLAAFEAYKRHYKLKKSEIASLSLQMLHLEQMMKKLKQFVSNKELLTEIEWVRLFQRYLYYLEHMLYFQEQFKTQLVDEELDV